MPIYDLAELNTHIVDLKRSKWDEARSDRQSGIYHFHPGPESKVYIKTSDYEDDASRPAHILKFVDVERLPYHRAKFGAEPVTIHDPYWPEPMVPDASGQYKYIDAILVKIADMEGYIDYRQGERSRGHAGLKEEGQTFSSAAKSEGAGLRDGDLGETRDKK
jgi:hypothetical protein